MGSGSSKRTVSPNTTANAASNQTQRQVQPAEEEEYTEDKSQRVVLITGCSTGIGLALAALLANDSDKRFKVYATMRILGKKGALEAKTTEAGDLIAIKELDVCSEESVKSAVDGIIEEEGRIDVLVNNAGIGLFCVAECANIETVKKIFETNVFGLMRMTSAVIPHMKSQQTGHIINITGVQGIAGAPFGEIYSASKFAVEGYTESLAPVLSHFNIRCSIVEPGPVATNFTVNAKSLREEIDMSSVDEKTKDLLASALKSMYHSVTLHKQTPEEIAERLLKVLLLKRPALRYQTNSEYRADQVATKLSADPTGQRILELTTKYLFPDQ